MSYERADEYRRRAGHLRTLANDLEHTPSMSLGQHAGVDTWTGPRADECCRSLTSARHAILDAVDDLRSTAWHFDRTADELDAAALAASETAYG